MLKRTRAQTSIERLTLEWRAKPSWWKEVLFIGVFYGLYSVVRNIRGNGSLLSVEDAQDHAESVVKAESALHIYSERQIQDWFLPHHAIIKFFDVWYGTVHFIVTIGVLLWLYHMKTERYRKWRNVVFATTFFALVGYMVYPLAPPRLLPSHYGFVDTLDTIGGLWNFDSSTTAKLSNQYAAMPSLHTAWSLWSAFALLPVLRHWWSRVLLLLYPIITITTIIVTANHYWLDVFGGAISLALGYALASVFDRRRRLAFVKRFEELRRGPSFEESTSKTDLISSPFA